MDLRGEMGEISVVGLFIWSDGSDDIVIAALELFGGQIVKEIQ